jgi:hypothetical protein
VIVPSETTPAVLLDTNAYRGLGNSQFDALVDLERARGVTRYAEPLALTELLAHLADPTDAREFGSCRAAVVRMFRRCAGDGPCGIIRDGESRLAEALTGKGLAAHDEHTNQLGYLLEHVGRGLPLSAIGSQLRTLADYVAATEARWADPMRTLQQRIAAIREDDRRQRAAAIRPEDAERNKIGNPGMRARTAERNRHVSAAKLLLDLAAVSAVGPPTAETIARLRRGAAPWIEFAVHVLDKVTYESVNVDAPEVRNLVWDQWLAYNIGQTIGRQTLWLVTDDDAFADAARATGFDDRVLKVAAYERWLAKPTKE